MEHYKNSERDTIIVFFGDHQPSLNSNFYPILNGKGLTGLTEDELEDFCKNVVSTGASIIETLYLGHDVLLGKEQREVLKKKGISIKIIPQYYYPELNG